MSLIQIHKNVYIYILIHIYIGSMCWNGKIPSRTGINHHIPCPHARSQKLSWKKKAMWQPKSVNRVNMIGLYQLTSCLLVNCWAGLVLQPFLDIFKEKNHRFNHRWFSNAPWAPSRCSTKFQSSIDFVWHFQCHTGNTVKSVTLGYMDIFRNLGVPSCSNVQVLLTGLHPKACL